MPHALPLLLRRELQHRAAARLALEWLAISWLLNSQRPGGHAIGMQWSMIWWTLLAMPCVACLLAPPWLACQRWIGRCWHGALRESVAAAMRLLLELLALGFMARGLATLAAG